MSAKRKKAIACLLACPTIVKAAKAAGVNEKTLRRWMAEPEFQAELRRARDEAFNVVVSRLGHIAMEALVLLTAAMRDRQVAAGTRVRAALGILAHATATHQADIEARVAELEHRLADGAAGTGVLEVPEVLSLQHYLEKYPANQPNEGKVNHERENHSDRH